MNGKGKEGKRKEITWTLYVFGVVVGVIVAFDHIGKSDA
jgi:hypothetical protein